jgi:hypothetical protein
MSYWREMGSPGTLGVQYACLILLNTGTDLLKTHKIGTVKGKSE